MNQNKRLQLALLFFRGPEIVALQLICSDLPSPPFSCLPLSPRPGHVKVFRSGRLLCRLSEPFQPSEQFFI